MPRLFGCSLLVLILLAPRPAKSLTSPCAGTDLFIAGTIPADSGVTQVFSARLDSDAENDLVLVRGGLGAFEVRLHAESSPSTPGASYSWDTPILRATLADLDADGHPDLAFTDDASRVVIFRGAADGTFSLGKTLTLSAPGFDLAAANVSTTPGLEIVVTHPTAGKLTTWMWTSGPFNYSPVETSISTYAADPAYLAVGRVNADGLQDVLVTRRANARIWLFRGTGSGSNGDGHFTASTSWLMPTPPTTLRLADLDLDGHVDFLCGTPSAVLWEFGHGDGTFSGGSSVPLSSAAVTDIAVADANVDSLPDILCTRIAPDVVTHIASTGLRAFVKLADFSVAGAPGALAELPQGGSGGHDFVVALRGDVGLASLVSRCEPPPDAVPGFDPRPIAKPPSDTEPPPSPPPLASPEYPPPPLPDPGPTPGVGPWPENGAVICDAPGAQIGLGGCDDFSHGAYFAWSDHRGADYDIYALRMAPNGQPAAGWHANGIPVCTTSGDQGAPICVTDGSWGVWVLWSDARSETPALYAQKLTAEGEIAEGWPEGGRPVCTSSDGAAITWFDAAADRSGGVVIVWEMGSPRRLAAVHLGGDGAVLSPWPECGRQFAAEYDLHGRCYDRWHFIDGAALLWPDRILSDEKDFGGIGNYEPPPYDFCWGFYVISNVHVSVYDASGQSAFGTTLEDFNSNYARGPDPNGGFYFLSSDGVLHRFGAFGNPTWNLMVGNRVIHSGLAGEIFTIDYWDHSLSRIENDGTWSAGLGSTGTPVCEGPCQIADREWFAPDGSGGGFVVWRDSRGSSADPPATDLYATWLRGDGTRGPGWLPDGNAFATTAAIEEPAVLIGDRRGAAIVGWQDARTGNANLYAYRLSSDPPTPTPARLSVERAEPDRVVLEWTFNAARGAVAIERRESEGPWVVLAIRSPDGSGAVHFEDTEVHPGTRYAYRLSIDGQTLDATAVTVPARSILALDGARPNPVTEGLTVGFSLSRAGDATLELVDVAGRLCGRWPLRGLAAGSHRIRAAGAADLAPGVYVITLRAEGQELRRKLVITR